MRTPLHVIITWTDACDRNETFLWDGTFDAAYKAAEKAPLYHNRQSTGFLIFINDEAVWLAHDFDPEENEIANLSVIPIGWITLIKTGRKVLYVRGEPR